MDKIAVLIPCYNESKTVEKVVTDFRRVLPQATIYVYDNNSTDGTAELAAKAGAVVRHEYQQGKGNVMRRMFREIDAEAYVLVDGDDTYPAEAAPEMVKAVTQEGFDCAGSRRVTRKGEPPVRSFFARRFYRLINRLSDVEIVDGARDFRCMNREYLNAVLSLKERNRFSKGIFPWVGFKTKWFEYENRERSVGETKWSFFKLLLYSLDGIAAFSTKPLAAASVCGFFFSFSSLLLILFIVVRKILFGGSSVDGWVSLVCTVLFMGGLQLLTIGLLGQYVAKIYIEVKQRPLFVIKEQK